MHQEYQFANDDVINPAVWENSVRMHRWFFQQSGARQWWSDWRHQFGAKFSDFVDGLIREGEAAG